MTIKPIRSKSLEKIPQGKENKETQQQKQNNPYKMRKRNQSRDGKILRK